MATLDKVYERYFRNIVKDGGGKWVGIQEVEGADYDLVMFNAPSGSTLALRSDEITTGKVIARIEKHQRKWARSVLEQRRNQTGIKGS